ncbi:MAG: hypothetical protein H6873_12935 [Hyphomicrobiaceae bacterium]|nr:hypothetical protein [Hyphomicrobiaceae bacterium]
MANYQELLSKAISALPENNGAARREVYERARKALVTQLRGLTPPLPAREITQHRLELEDCIRQVEQRATENILGGFRQLDDEPPMSSAPQAPQVRPRGADGISEMTPVQMAEPAPEPEPVEEPEPIEDLPDDVAAEEPEPMPEPEPAPAVAKAPVQPSAPKAQPSGPAYDEQAGAIDAIIARADTNRRNDPPVPADGRYSGMGRPGLPRAVAEAQMARPESVSPTPAPHAHHFDSESETLVDDGTDEAAEFEDTSAAPEVEEAPVAAPNLNLPPVPASDPRIKKPSAEELIRNAQAGANGGAKRPAAEGVVGTAMSQVREVELDQSVSIDMDDEEREAQSVVDRAIQILDREARGEQDEDRTDDDEPMVEHDDDLPLTAEREVKGGKGRAASRAALAGDDDVLSSDDEEGGGNALTIFLVIAVVLLLLVGGGTFWAWREGYIPLDDIFGGKNQAVATADANNAAAPADNEAGPGNTATNTNAVQPADQANAVTDETTPAEDRLVSEQTSAATDQTNGGEDRLVSTDERAADPAIDSTTADATSTGAQSLLLEASSTGQTGAVPYSGTVSWERGVDELGAPTLIGKATIPARNLSVQVLIRRNADPTLPASHLFEIEFKTSDTFVGGSIASFGGILFKNEELVPGKALVGAPARIFENMFLFALSSSDQDVKNNVPLMRDDKWMDLALIYGTGRQAIVTLEKDDAAQQLFNDVFAAWDAAAAQQSSN